MFLGIDNALFQNDALKNVDIITYFECFDLNKDNPPKLVYGKGVTKFYYFLSQISAVTQKIALERFGINNFNQLKQKHKPTTIFARKVKEILDIKVN